MIITNLGTLGGSDSTANAINDQGHVLGSSKIEGDSDNPFDAHSFLWKDGTLHDIGQCYGSALNNHDQVAATLMDSTLNSFEPELLFSTRPRLWTDGQFRDLLPPGASFGSATAINDHGQVVMPTATVSTENEKQKVEMRLCLWQEGQFSYLTIPPDYVSGVPRAINNQGQVVGLLQILSPGAIPPPSFAAMWDGQSAIALNLPSGFTQTDAVAINNYSQILVRGYVSSSTDPVKELNGYTFPRGKQAGFLWEHGQITLINAGPNALIPRRLNDQGQVVGKLFQGEGKSTAFLWQDGQLTDLNTLIPKDSGWVLTDATDINNHGQIVGSGEHDGKSHAYLLTPASHSGS